MKDEFGGTAIYDFTGTKSKMYSIRDVNNHGKSVYKGHISLIKNEEFKYVHSNKKVIRHKMRGFKSINHKYIHTKVIKHLYLVMMISDMFLLME